ncbi:MAG: DNA recombination protein RmuC [Gammaproteobacteria bacterium]|nr:DNA recombination protein RmuC [Gammaproteobacteria bacterium]
MMEYLHEITSKINQSFNSLNEQSKKEHHDFRQQFDHHQLKTLNVLQESLSQGLQSVSARIHETLTFNADTLGKRVEKLTQDTDLRLKEISGQVDRRLTEGFEKTTATFVDVLTRLAIIDEAQKKITELSNNVVSLQEILSDKRSRGAFGEVQLSSLIHNVIPASHVKLQHDLSNGKRADCFLLLPEPTGNIVIDAKFPLESYRTMTNIQLGESDRRNAEKQFRIDVRKHIQDIAQKYILPGETADGAMMFIPAESIFAEIHANHPELIEEAHKLRVWLASPSTMMAILTTARAVIKDAATRKQIHVIQEHLSYLAQDFQRFQERMDQLARHINQAHGDIQDVQTSARKITNRFVKIEKVELEKTALQDLEEPS